MNAMRALLRHPIVHAGLSLLVLRMAVIAGWNVVRPPHEWGPVLATLGFHAGETVLLVALMLGAWKILPFARVVLTALALVVLALLCFLSVSDPILVSVIGERLTPSTLSHFAGPRLFVSDDFWMPVRRHGVAVGAALTVLLGYLAWLVRLMVRRGLRPDSTPVALVPVLVVGGAGLALAAGAELASGRRADHPVELQFAAQVLGIDDTRISEAEAVGALRSALPLPPGARWLSDRYPLVYGYPEPARMAAGGRPDIVLVVIESLRGENLRFINPASSWHVETPHLEALARRGVVFDRYLSNAFPTGPGFVAIAYSAWPHTVRRITDDFGGTRFDGIGARMTSLGYATLHAEADPSYDRREKWVRGQFTDIVDLAARGMPLTEESLVDAVIAWIREKDAAASGAPLFALVMTAQPHLPFAWPDGEGRYTFGPVLDENYRRSLRHVDAQLGRLFAFLEERGRRRDTVIVVTGDHANFADQKATTGLPVNDVGWTGAVFVGPEQLIGPPRRVSEPASHVDLSPTLQALAGDRRPTAALGRNLFAPDPGGRRFAVMIRAGGSRLEDGRLSLVLPNHDPARARTLRSFPFDPADDAPEPAMTPQALATLARSWAWLMENDRIWSPDFLQARVPTGMENRDD